MCDRVLRSYFQLLYNYIIHWKVV